MSSGILECSFMGAVFRRNGEDAVRLLAENGAVSIVRNEWLNAWRLAELSVLRSTCRSSDYPTTWSPWRANACRSHRKEPKEILTLWHDSESSLGSRETCSG